MIKVKPYIVVDYMTFGRRLMGDLDEFIADLEEVRLAVKAATNYKWDNSNMRMSNSSGTEFAFQLRKHTQFGIREAWHEISVWDSRGNTSIISFVISTSLDERKKQLVKLMRLCSEFAAGEVHCHDCGKLQKYEDIKNNRYFAGIYCDECWEREWKAIEAKETYD